LWESPLGKYGRISRWPRPCRRAADSATGQNLTSDDYRKAARVIANQNPVACQTPVAALIQRICNRECAAEGAEAIGVTAVAEIVVRVIALTRTGEAHVITTDRLTLRAQIPRQRLRGGRRRAVLDQTADLGIIPVSVRFDQLELKRGA
jgi:hypothetical protein